MVQTVNSVILFPGQQKIFCEKPLALCRIFFKISALLPLTANYGSRISFDDPTFYAYYLLLGPVISFEAKGEGIFQGNVWVRNVSAINITYSTTEILV